MTGDFGELTSGENILSEVEAPARFIGQTDIEVYPVALGGAVFGWTLPSGRSTDLLDRFVELGGNLVDTSDSYSSGMSEQIIGKWMRERGNRNSVVVATKVGRHPEYPGLSAQNIISAVEASLERLQSDHIDLLYFHAEDPQVSLEESLSAVETLMQAGKVRALGASNFSADRLLEARIAAGSGLPRFEAVALEYSLLRRDIVEGNIAMMSIAQRMSVMPYFVLANGYLGRHRNIKTFNPSDTRARRAAQHGGRHGAHVLKTLDNIAMSQGVDISTIALAWVLGRPAVGVPTVGVESIRELEALMHAPQVVLTRQQIAELDRASAEQGRNWLPGRTRS
ncbi:aldo/keto reductase [Aurantimicrobium minutum]|uniref:aldo/keto reductase n=1 Tax=Aurantimicrobium minutum TaxID=708131 RepID=UPI002476A027|nr:aldo/keto reductase [Aurantimicrobium minutum]MDH6422867.1 aryl-alcohol dehydrogenase-like predicted oxidoreductase [Aurantimicrobium minutum]